MVSNTQLEVLFGEQQSGGGAVSMVTNSQVNLLLVWRGTVRCEAL